MTTAGTVTTSSGAATMGLHPWDRISVRHFAAVPAAVRDARRHAAGILRGWGLDDLLDSAELLVSELATNAVQAAGGTGGQSGQGGQDTPAVGQERIALRFTCTDTNFVIEVWDATPSRPVRKTRDLVAEGGRGLFLVEALSQDWGYYRPRVSGKVVWCALRLTRSLVPVACGPGGMPFPLPRRKPGSVPESSAPVEMTADDIQLLRRVVDGLRALDGWYLPTDAGRQGPHTR